MYGIELTNLWSAPFPLVAGDILEVRGVGDIWISEDIENPSYDNALVLRLDEPHTVLYTMIVVARSETPAGNTLAVIEGFPNQPPGVTPPEIVTLPTLTLIDGVLHRTTGEAVGEPVPVLDRIVWRRNGLVIPGAEGETYDPRGVPGTYVTEDVWSGAGETVGASLPIVYDGTAVAISADPDNILEQRHDGLFAAPRYTLAQW